MGLEVNHFSPCLPELVQLRRATAFQGQNHRTWAELVATCKPLE